MFHYELNISDYFEVFSFFFRFFLRGVGGGGEREGGEGGGEREGGRGRREGDKLLVLL